MSIKRLNADERATYLLGLAVRRQLDARDPYPQEDIGVIVRMVQRWLTPDEADHICLETGLITDDDFLADLMSGVPTISEKPTDEPDDIPF